MNAEGQRPIFIIRRQVQANAHHGGGWKIAYADFMTAMMAFFLVMWLLSISTPKQLAGIAEHFKTPLKVAMAGGPAASLSSSVIPGGGPSPVHSVGESGSTSANPGAESTQEGPGAMSALKQKLDALIESSPVLKQFRPQLLIDLTPEGLRLQIIDSQQRPMFDRSSAVVVPALAQILREIGPVLNAQSQKITLSGHTDATQYAQGGRAYGNWELSADRANASRRELLVGGMAEAKVLRVIGVAASVPLNARQPYADMNRRISIVVLNRQAQANIEGAAASAPAAPEPSALSSPPALPALPLSPALPQERHDPP